MANYSSYAPEHSDIYADVTPERIEAMRTLENMGLLNRHAVSIAQHENRINKALVNDAIARSDNPAYFEQRFEFNN